MTIKHYVKGLEETLDKHINVDTDIGNMVRCISITEDGITLSLKPFADKTYADIYKTLIDKENNND